ncbi:hypothetical protein VTP01DRAFT_9062 [Rhizomucor pusillus]|uniref:uncharacterized protein n=1 Tax=Rhizomucor pusillus TaxID=4840 RepID=UPI003743FBC6
MAPRSVSSHASSAQVAIVISRMGSVKPMFRNDLNGVDAYTRHKRYIQSYFLHYNRGSPPKGSNVPENYKTEYDIVRENHKFVWDNEEEDEGTWEQRVAKKYYDKLFKEYAICDLKYYKQGKIALRWRTESEVISGKGQFVCASNRCDNTKKLTSWEVNFGYIEHGEKKNELVKVRLCPECSDKLNYKTQKRQAKKESKKRKRKEESESEDEREDDSRGKRSKQASSEDEDGEHEEKHAKDEASSIWSKPIETREEKSKEEEYEDYFADLLQ